MKRKLSVKEKNQIAYLQKRKDELLENFIGACQEINNQISEVKNGSWIHSVEGGNSDEKPQQTGH